MANTYTLINSNTLSSSAASVTFSSIPSTYTDLVLKISAKSTSGATSNVDLVYLTFNNDTTALYSYTAIRGNGASASSVATSNNNPSSVPVGYISNSNMDASTTFGNAEVYIPSYLASQNKPYAGFGVGEANATTVWLNATADLYRSNTAISTITCGLTSGSNFVTNSSFYLYGIKNS